MAIYCTFKNIYINNECEAYLKFLTVVKHSIALSKLRLSSHHLAIEKGRWKNELPKEFVYFVKGDILPDYGAGRRISFCVLLSSIFFSIRKHYLFFEYANYNTFVNIMSSVDIKIVQT